MGLTECLSKYYCNNCLLTKICFEKPDILLFENYNKINPIGLGSSCAYYKNKKLFTNIEI